VLVTAVIGIAGCQTSGPTRITIGANVIRTNVKRLGINLSSQSFYDSGQMLRDISYRNPGFEGEIWQSVMQCKAVRENACADTNEWSSWPADFVKGASFEFFYGAAKGETGVIASSSTASNSAHQGVWVNFGHLTVPPKAGDFYILRMRVPGNGEAGWWPATEGGATISTEFKDISPHSPGKQALRLSAMAPSQSASVVSNIDTWSGKSFLQLKGTYVLNFRAKPVGGSNRLELSIARLAQAKGVVSYLKESVSLTTGWKDFQYSFQAQEDGTFVGPIQLIFRIEGGAILLDDVSLVEGANQDNPTVFRNAVVDRLRELRPGVLRYMDNGRNFGSTIDNLLAPAFARERAGFSATDSKQEDVPIGLQDFLVLCEAVHAEPWFTMPGGMSQAEMNDLVEYLAGPASTRYGAMRERNGHPAPWTSVFPEIHLELGNETWNAGSVGENVLDPVAYATRAATIFAAARSAPYFDKTKFDLILDGWAAVTWWNEQELSVHTHADSIDIAPYTFNPFQDASSTEAVFGPMLAEPEMLDSRPSGVVAAQAKIAAKAGVKLAVYEVNLGTTQGNLSQAAVDSAVPSIGAGLSVAEHMLLMLRDDGIETQALFCLPEYVNGYGEREAHETTPLWGAVIDMGGPTNRVRPVFLAEELANSAVEKTMLGTMQSGSNPTWNQPKSANGNVLLQGAHLIQSFAFTGDGRSSVVVFNLSRTESLPVTFSGPNAPHGRVQMSRLTSAKITDSNETSATVATKKETIAAFDPAAPLSLPPFSMTLLSWTAR
jgi:hypothetical protein